MNRIRLSVASLAFLSAAALTAPSYALDREHHIGTPVAAQAAAEARRTIVVNDRTRSVNVEHGETVLFLVNGPNGQTSRVWRFDGMDLALPFTDVSPDAPAKSLRVYVDQSTNPLAQADGDD